MYSCGAVRVGPLHQEPGHPRTVGQSADGHDPHRAPGPKSTYLI
jgi:hypothetical protein